MNNMLIVPYKKFFTSTSANGLIIIIAASLFLLGLSILYARHMGRYLAWTIQALLVLWNIVLIGAFVNAYYIDKSDEPALILNQEGIRIKFHGIIPWDNIQEINTYCIPTTPMPAIGIKIKNPSLVSANAPWSGKVSLFWATLFGYYYHITITNIALDYDVVVNFSRQFLS
ncbi:hypothetical protein KJZ61_04470 [Candidatus Dependentiae bacterium]|nr:hypothetical protein [Candidatus Dependentiae bacterium]